MFHTVELFLLAIAVGGMVTFQCLFAPLIFIKIEMPVARAFIRSFFPFYYLYFGLINLLLLLVSLRNIDMSFYLYGCCLLGFVVSRQWLMLAANQATDAGSKKSFAIYHRTTVAINTLQLIAFSYLLWQFSEYSTYAN